MKIRRSSLIFFFFRELFSGTHNHIILDSERSEEYIDFTMIITSRNNAPISNYRGGFRCKSEYPWCIIEIKILKKIEKNKKKMTEKREFLRKTSFRPNRIFFMVVIQKLITETT
ncbi:Uncharacterized protein FWK35_00021802 [Aphis craccivora]|uniref:Uncharacterized protein n=1 Tax=Aphis craccivora TaxID=307492 RepID=A0A6G0VZN2_APHCR|nr:Uncharacterized protein FWK35_00021802 [Aphis craccivora]